MGKAMPCKRSTISRKQTGIAIMGILALFSNTALAANAACIDAAAARFGVPSGVLHAIVQQETSGRCTARHPANRNGTYDIGCAGINSAWVPTLARQFGITEQVLRDPCTNIHVGAWILARNVRRHGNTWRAVGAYNTTTESKRREYAWKIVTHMQRHAAR
jgi:soluble lytic murein transglycosylase-like protein